MNVSISHPTDRPNFSRVRVGDMDLWFSYETCIAFHGPEGDLVVHENVWGPTTGKHLNYIDDGKNNRRVPSEVFDKLLSTFTVQVNKNG